MTRRLPWLALPRRTADARQHTADHPGASLPTGRLRQPAQPDRRFSSSPGPSPAAASRRSRPLDAPLLSRFKAMDMDERWVSRSPEVMLESVHWFQGELFTMIVEDLLLFPAEPGVIAEGFRLLPGLVQPLLARPGQAVWLLPTPGFRRAAFAGRGSLWQIASKTSDPEEALRSLLERDRLFTGFLAGETRRLELRSVEVATPTAEGDLADRVRGLFAACTPWRSPCGRVSASSPCGRPVPLLPGALVMKSQDV